MRDAIDFNCDLGEQPGDLALMPWISSANIACGGHAGDRASMQAAIRACLEHGVAIGAHPSYLDRDGFGRRALEVAPETLRSQVTAQIETLAGIAAAEGARLTHVKPHGALYNRAADDREVAEAIADAVYGCDPALILVGLSGSALPRAGQARGLQVAHEVFAERRYRADGRLTPRSAADAVLANVADALQQVHRLLVDGSVLSRDGRAVALSADTLCLHGDRPDALAFAQAIRAQLAADGIAVRALPRTGTAR